MPRHRLSDYVNAFVTSVKMTARGQKPPSLQAEANHAPLFGWFRETVALVAAVESAAKAENIDPKAVVFRLDSRVTTLKTVLESIHFHAAQEYPMLLHQRSQYALIAIQATNLNDRFALLRLNEAEGLTDELRKPLTALARHLEVLPKN